MKHPRAGRPASNFTRRWKDPHARVDCRCKIQSPPAFTALLREMERAAVTSLSWLPPPFFVRGFWPSLELRPIQGLQAKKSDRKSKQKRGDPSVAFQPRLPGDPFIAPAPKCTDMRATPRAVGGIHRRTVGTPGPDRIDAPPDPLLGMHAYLRAVFFCDDVRWLLRSWKPHPDQNERILFIYWKTCAALDNSSRH